MKTRRFTGFALGGLWLLACGTPPATGTMDSAVDSSAQDTASTSADAESDAVTEPDVVSVTDAAIDVAMSADAMPAPDAAVDVPTRTDTVMAPEASVDAGVDRYAQLLTTLRETDRTLLQTRPGLVAGRYQRMALDSFQFYRGNVPFFLRDWNDASTGLSQTAFAAPLRVWSLGDAHPENFGILRPLSGPSLFEGNDLDAVDRLPYLWDVRRLAVGVCLAARNANPSSASARSASSAAAGDLVQTMLRAYVQEMARLAGGGTRMAITSGAGSVVLTDLYSRSDRDRASREELQTLTTVTGSTRRLLRGAMDPAEPDVLLRDLHPTAYAALDPLLQRYRSTLRTAPAPEYFRVLDAVQQLGSGVGSRPRIRVLALVRGPTDTPDDDVLLQIKELAPPPALADPGAVLWASNEERILAARAGVWSRPDADSLWGAGSWLSFSVQVRTESEAFKTLRVSRLDGERGTIAALDDIAGRLGTVLADIHGMPTPEQSRPASVLSPVLQRSVDGFVREQRTIALSYCDRVETDLDVFRSILRMEGLALGIAATPAAVATPELRALFAPPIPTMPATVVINEVSALGESWVEFFNNDSVAADLSNMIVADSATDGTARVAEGVTIPAGTLIPPGGYLLVVGGFASPSTGFQSACGMTGATRCLQAGWNLSASRGETVWLLRSGGMVVAQQAFPTMGVATGQTFGRIPDGAGAFGACMPTPNAPNRR